MGEKLKDIIRFVLEHILWLVSCAGAFYLMLRTRSTLLYGSVALFANASMANNRVGMVDKFAIIIIGVALISFVVLIEYHYIHATSLRDLASRFAAVTGIEVLVLGLLIFLFQVVVGLENTSTALALLLVAQTAGGALLVTNRLWLQKLFKVQVRQEVV